MSRSPVSKKVRFDVFKRDSFKCQYCGAHPPTVMLHLDHIDPVSLGGGNDEANLITSCEACNLGKGAKPLNVAPMTLEQRAILVQEREAQLAGYAAIMEAARERVEDDCWRVAEALQNGASNGYSVARLASIKKFVTTLGVYKTLEAAEMAVAKRPYSHPQAFKYFCGICWNWIRDANDEL